METESDFVAFEKVVYTKSWNSADDFPTYEPDETKVRADLQLLHDEAKDGINRLIDALNDPTAAAQLPFAPVAPLTATTVQQAIEEVYRHVKDAAAGLIVDGSVTKEKIEQSLLEKIYGGRMVVCLDTPGAQHDPDADYPVGQLWLRPGFMLENLAQQEWETENCTVAQDGDGWTILSDGAADYFTASQLVEHAGEAGQQLLVQVEADDADIWDNVSLVINGVEVEQPEQPVEVQPDQSGALEILLRGETAQQDMTELVIRKLVVINTGKLQAQLGASCADWSAYLQQLNGAWVQVPTAVYLQTAPGVWQSVYEEVLAVSAGGTGLKSVAQGAVIYGTGGAQLAALAPEEGLVLQSGKTAPRWVQPQTLVQQAGGLRIVSGSYTGTGSDATVELPVAPKLMFLWPDNKDDATAVVAGGSKAEKSYTYITQKGVAAFYTAAAELTGDLLRFTHLTVSGDGTGVCSRYMNEDGAAYSYLAVY